MPAPVGSLLAALPPDLAAVLGAVVGLLVGALVAGSLVRARSRRRLAALEASEARHRLLFDEAVDVVLVHDPDGTALVANRAGRAVLGLAEGDPAVSLLDAVDVSDRAGARAHLATLMESDRVRSDLRLRGPGPEPILLEVVSGMVEVDGRRRVVSVGRDVGARRAQERRLAEARDQAEEAARVRSQFLATMSHEIRTPLTSVLGFAELLRDEVGDAQRGLVEAIEAGGQRLLVTLDSVLDLATLDARRETLRPAPLDVVCEVEAAVDKVRPQAEARGLRLDVEASAPSIPASLDSNGLGRILAHLVGNAIQFTHSGGVTVEVEADAEAVSLRVIDTGIGIPEDALPGLFDGFRKPSEGHGFGLAITERLVRLMGGTIALESRWRSGTAVTVVLPRGMAEAFEPAPHEDEVAA